jgi:uncharacterized membrane protein YqjE
MRGAGEALVGLIGTRMELFGIELREEGVQFQRMLVLGIIAAFCLGSALVLVGLLIVAAFWDRFGLLALGAVALLYAIAGVAGLMRLRSSIYQRPAPFAATVRELEEDLRALRETSGGPESSPGTAP